MKSTFSVQSAIIAVLLAGNATAYHLGGSKPRAIRNGRRQFDVPEESVSPDISTVSDSLPSSFPTASNSDDIPVPSATGSDSLLPTLSFTPSTGVPSAGGPPFPTGFNSTFAPGPFPTATGVPIPGSGSGDDGSDTGSGPTTSVDCSAMASSIFGSIFPYPTGGGFPGWPGFPTGGATGSPGQGPIPSIIFGPPSVSFAGPSGPLPTGSLGPPIIGGPSLSMVQPGSGSTPSASAPPAGSASTTTSESSPASSIPTGSPIVEKRFPIGFGRPRAGGPIPAGVFPPGHAYPTGNFPTPTEEQVAQISHFFEVCGWGKGKGKGKGKGPGHGHWWPGKGAVEPQPVVESGSGKPGCDKGDE
ncbi:hypothetical protein QBC37DRAFT_432066 [Rhypophila decipiens]|uniref:Uncharacterized protein n=1 Tax=Rhypophila decipiens TaxID=261697 RepID=A0AAN6XZC0_9PEZI|nr:hypothetical protein QBC37DRAFT_432066 [Rhypophila decipiens]